MITVEHRAFTRALKLATGVVERRHTIPALGGVKLVANGQLAIEGSNLDTFARAEIPYSGEAGELFLSEPRAVSAALGAAGGHEVSFEPEDEGKRVRVRSGALDASLTALPVDDHPGAERITETAFGCEIGQEALAQIARVMKAVSREETRYYLNGVNVRHLGDWTYRFAATDGHRLMMVDVPLPDAEGALPGDLILPRAWIQLALTAFAKAPEGLALRVGYRAWRNVKPADLPLDQQRRLARVSLAGDVGGIALELSSKLIDGMYPDYGRVIPGHLDCGARFDRRALAQAVHALMPLGEGHVRAISLTFDADRVVLRLNSPVLGEGAFEVPAECRWIPTGARVGINAQYLLDILGALRGDVVEIGFVAESIDHNPMTLVDPADTAFKAVLMPMRV